MNRLKIALLYSDPLENAVVKWHWCVRIDRVYFTKICQDQEFLSHFALSQNITC